MEFAKMLTLSTAYIPPKIAELLNDEESVINGHISVYPKKIVGESGEYGWYIDVPTHWAEHRKKHTIDPEFPEILAKLLDLCVRANSQVLCLDREGSVLTDEDTQFYGIERLPVFNWENPNGKRCPKCGGQRFIVTAHVTQDWIVDEDGDFMKCLKDCVDVTHNPDDDDLWECERCGFSAAGSEFNPA